MSTERVIVHESLASEFEQALKEAVEPIQDRRFDLIRPAAAEELKSVVAGAIDSVSPSLCPNGSDPVCRTCIDQITTCLTASQLHGDAWISSSVVFSGEAEGTGRSPHHLGTEHFRHDILTHHPC